MTRTLLLWDRLAVLVAAALLAVLGLLGLSWWFEIWPHLTQRVDLGRARTATGASWWPLALIAAGIVLVVLGLAWLLAHVRSHRVKRLTLRGSSGAAPLDVDAGKLVSAAASAFGDTAGVRSSRGHLEKDRGQLVAHLAATLEPDVSLAAVARRADEVSAQLQRALDRSDVRCRFVLKVAAHRALRGGDGATGSRVA